MVDRDRAVEGRVRGGAERGKAGRGGAPLPRPGARRDGALAHGKMSQEHGRDRDDEAKSGCGLPSRFKQRRDGRDGEIDGGGAKLGALGPGLGFWGLGLRRGACRRVAALFIAHGEHQGARGSEAEAEVAAAAPSDSDRRFGAALRGRAHPSVGEGAGALLRAAG